MINKLIRKVIQVDIKKRIGWEEYFNDEFFKKNINEIEKINDIEKLNKIKDKNEEIKENDSKSSVISTSGKGTTSNVETKTQSIMDGKSSANSTTKMGTNTTVGTNTQSILRQFDDSNLVFEGKYLNINKKSYKIFREIGKTKNGDLFLINDDENNNLFIVNKIEIKSNEEKNKILIEIEKLNKIDSEYIIKIDKHFIEKENNKEFGYFFIKYYKNNLEKIIYELNFLNSRNIWKIFIQIILGLQSLYLNNIFVKYFKTKNIFLDNENNIKIAGINDFLDFTDENEEEFLYFPENEEINDKSNIFSLGCILYELVLKKKLSKNKIDLDSEKCENDFKIILSKLLCEKEKRLTLNEILLEPLIKKIIIELNLFDEIIKINIKGKNNFYNIFYRF
jgi:serine/threonine protein kinase